MQDGDKRGVMRKNHPQLHLSLLKMMSHAKLKLLIADYTCLLMFVLVGILVRVSDAVSPWSQHISFGDGF